MKMSMLRYHDGERRKKRFPGYHGVKTFHPDHWSKNEVRVEHSYAKVAVEALMFVAPDSVV